MKSGALGFNFIELAAEMGGGGGLVNGGSFDCEKLFTLLPIPDMCICPEFEAGTENR
jgi:hypothetical protein